MGSNLTKPAHWFLYSFLPEALPSHVLPLFIHFCIKHRKHVKPVRIPQTLQASFHPASQHLPCTVDHTTPGEVVCQHDVHQPPQAASRKFGTVSTSLCFSPTESISRETTAVSRPHTFAGPSYGKALALRGACKIIRAETSNMIPSSTLSVSDDLTHITCWSIPKLHTCRIRRLVVDDFVCLGSDPVEEYEGHASACVGRNLRDPISPSERSDRSFSVLEQLQCEHGYTYKRSA